MVDTDKKTDEGKADDATAPNVADLHVSTIIAALHQTALEHSNAASKNATVANSALEGDGKDAKLASAGEHIISAIPNEGIVLKKSDAIAILSQYVQWFVGPDLAKKVNDNTVKALTEAPGSNKNESKKFMSFGQFLLLEADEETEGSEKPKSDGEPPNEETSTEDSGDKKPEDKKDSKSSDGKKDGGGKEDVDEAKESKTGYYIAYDLKVEGLPQKALKDSMKKFAKTFFDDVTIRASGLFGGSQSFTVKDVKDALNSVFGPIDPDQLIDYVEKDIRKKYPNSDPIDVRVRDKDTLISDVGNQIDASQKSKIASSDYSLWIKVTEHDPKKPLLNPRTVADIVQSSIKGLFKKFTNKITKNDVVLIQNYRDEHADTKRLKNLYTSVPKIEEFQGLVDQAKTANVLFKQIESRLDKLKKDSEYERCGRAKACVKTWENFKDSLDKNGGVSKLEGMRDKDKIKEQFKGFFDAYKKAFKENRNAELDESLSLSISLAAVKKLVIESMFGSLLEDETGSQTSDKAKTISKQRATAIVDALTLMAKEEFGKSAKIYAASKDQIDSKIKNYRNHAEAFKDDSYPYALVISFDDSDGISQSDAEQLSEKQQISNEIMKLLLNEVDDADANVDNEKSKSSIDFNGMTLKFEDALKKTASGGKKSKLLKIYATIGTSDDVLKWLQNYNLATSGIEAKLKDHKYAAANVVKMPKKFNDAGKIDEKNGKLCKGSAGHSIFTNDTVKRDLEKAIDKKIDEPVVEYEATANKELKYNNTQMPATCKVRVLLLDDLGEENNKDSSSSDKDEQKDNGNDNDSGNDNTQNDQSNSQDTEDTEKNGKITVDDIQSFIDGAKDHDQVAIDKVGNITQLYVNKPNKPSEVFVVPFDIVTKEGDVVDVDVDDAGDVDVGDGSKGKEDLYIIPMPKLKYKDKEYEGTYA